MKALVTGASSGIGLATAVGLAQRGVDVVATVRTPSEALHEASAGLPVEVRTLDVTDAAAGQALVDSLGGLDLLVNNAGRGQLGTLEELTDDEPRNCLETNFVAVARLTRAVLPHLRATRGRVVTVSSVGGVVGQPFNDAYCAAKFAVEGLMQSLAPVAARVGVGVHVVEPGPVATSFVANVGRAESTGPYAGMLDAYATRTAGVFAGAQSAQEVAQVVIGACLDEGVPFRVQTSDAARAFAGLSLADLDGSRVLAATAQFI